MSEKIILLVEDNTIQREGLAAVLRRDGYAVLPAAEAREAIALVKGGAAPDLVLLDMMIPPPGADGWRFLDARKRIPALASVPIVITTGLGVAGEEWAASLGASGLLRKPVEAGPQLDLVRRCLGDVQR